MGCLDGYIDGDAKKIIDHGPPFERWNLVVMGDGYTEDEQAKFQADVDAFVQKLFDSAPFSALDIELAVNIWRVDVISKESGADDPPGCFGTDAQVSTYFDASLCDDGIPFWLAIDFGSAK